MTQSSRMLTTVQRFASAASSTFRRGDVIELVVGIVVQHKHPQRQAGRAHPSANDPHDGMSVQHRNRDLTGVPLSALAERSAPSTFACIVKFVVWRCCYRKVLRS
jgi:hypothetical protein